MASMSSISFTGKMPELQLPKGSVVNELTATIDLPAGEEVSFAHAALDTSASAPSAANPRRDLAVTGRRSVLVVRVVAADNSTTDSVERLSDSVFGNGADGSADHVTMRSQYLACSYDQLEFVEANDRDGTNSNIRNGAVTVTVSSATSAGYGVIFNEIVDVLNAEFGVSSPEALAEHVMMCMPPGTMDGWAVAYASINGWDSVYDDKWCTYLSIQLHEMGHNLGLGHSNEGWTYQDQSGMMGFSYCEDDTPVMCFNGPKSWQLGWYALRQHVFNQADVSWSGRLIGQVDHENQDAISTDVVLLKLNTGIHKDYYVSFNRQTGTNSGTIEGGDQVMISRAGREARIGSQSELLAKMAGGGSYTIGNFDDSGLDLTLTVDSIDTGANPGYAEITVTAGCTDCWEDGTNCFVGWGWSCNQCQNPATWWLRMDPEGYRCGTEPPKNLAVNQQCHKTGDISNLVACWSKESLLEKSDIPLNCFKRDYALSLHTLPGPHFLLLAQRKERMNDEECPSNVAFDYVEGGMAEVFMEDMGNFSQHMLGSRPLSDILQAQEKAEAHTEKASEYNLETNTCLHYARDVWSSLGLADTADMAEFIIEGVFNDSNSANLAMKHSGGTGYLTAKANGRQELRNYIKDVVNSQLDVTTA